MKNNHIAAKGGLLLIFLVAFVLSSGSAYAQQYVFDNANILDETPVASEIDSFNKQTGGIIIIETINGDDVDPEEMFHAKHKLGTGGNPELNVLIVFDMKENKGFVVYSRLHCKLKTAYNGIFNTEEVRQGIKDKKYTEAFLGIVKKIKTEAGKNYFCPLDRPRQTFGCIFGSEEKPKIVERIIDNKPDRQKITPTAIVLHFTGSATLEESIGKLASRDLVVQFMVDKDGTIYQLMKDIGTMSSGARCANRNSINVEIVGSGEKELLESKEQFQAVAGLMRWLSQQYDIDLLQQKASSPQGGLVAHSEVDLECPRATGKFDPGGLYMAKIRTNLCRRSMFFDLSGSEIPTKEGLQQNKALLEKLNGIRNNVVHVVFTDRLASKDEIDGITESSIAPDCTLVMQASGKSVSLYSLPLTCALKQEEIKEVEGRISRSLAQGIGQRRIADATFLAASAVSEKMDRVIAEESAPSIISGVSDAAAQLSVVVSDFLNPTGCAACPTAEGYSQQVMSAASKLSSGQINEAYQKAKAKYAPGSDPFAHTKRTIPDFEKLKAGVYEFKETLMSERLKTWPLYVFPQFFPEKIKDNRKIPVNVDNRDFDVDIPGVPALSPQGLTISLDPSNPTYSHIEFGDFETHVGFADEGNCSYAVLSKGRETKKAAVNCGEKFTITVGPNGDCRDEGINACLFMRKRTFAGVEVAYPDKISIAFTDSVCSYRVVSKGKVTKESKIRCGSDITITVGPNGDCRDEGMDACVVETAAELRDGTISNSGKYNIGPFDDMCAYKVLSGGVVTREGKVRCASRTKITVGPNGDCRNEGRDTCRVNTYIGNAVARSLLYSISLKRVNDTYFFGQEFVAKVPGIWNCRLKVVSIDVIGIGDVTRDEKIPCWNGVDSNYVSVGIGISGDCNREGTCEITLSSGYVFKSSETHVIQVKGLNRIFVEGAEYNTGARQKMEEVIKALHHGVVAASQNKYGVKVSPEEVYIIAISEGLNGDLLDSYVLGTDGIKMNIFSAGIRPYAVQDTNALKNGAFISRNINAIDFSSSSLKDGLEFVAGTIAYRKYLFFQDLRGMGVEPSSLSRKQINFWVYLYYNTGPGNGKKLLKRFVHDGMLDDDSFINAKPGENVYNGPDSPQHNAIIRGVMIEAMHELGVLYLPGYSDAYR